RDMQQFRGAVDAAGKHHGTEDLHLPQVHGRLQGVNRSLTVGPFFSIAAAGAPANNAPTLALTAPPTGDKSP
ncbi:MAG TPA: hypothetical protein VK996_03175, partial [Ramlibacter sp.]|nr:hypothetical protein [Ramlibacter sp.]